MNKEKNAGLDLSAVAADVELELEALLCVLEGPPLVVCEGTLDGSELPALFVALPFAWRMT